MSMLVFINKVIKMGITLLLCGPVFVIGTDRFIPADE
jgi:hypothetical protein